MRARYVVLLRGINVGKAKRIAMADLRVLLADLGFGDVRTLLQSGNVLVTADEADPDRYARTVRAGIADRFGLDVRCVVLTADRLRAVLDGHPFTAIADDGSRMFAHVLSAAPDPARLAAHDPVALDPEFTRLGDRVLYQWCPDGLLQSPAVGAHAEKYLGVTVTTRNWNTLGKLAAVA